MNGVLPMGGGNPLTGVERGRLEQLEEVVACGLEGFRRAGQALAEIRDQRLYRQNHKTFTDYLRVRWELGKSRAYQLIDAAEAVEEMESICPQFVDVLPANEAQVRPLISLPDAPTRLEVWGRAVADAGGVPTAEQVSRQTARHLAGLDAAAQAAEINAEGAAAREERDRREADEAEKEQMEGLRKHLAKMDRLCQMLPEQRRGRLTMALSAVRRELDAMEEAA